MAMLLMTADRLFGMTNPLKRNTYNKSRKYRNDFNQEFVIFFYYFLSKLKIRKNRRFMIALMVITPFSFGFPRFMSGHSS